MDSDVGWRSLEETADHLSMGKTALYALARDGRIPAQKSVRSGFSTKPPWTLGFAQTSHLRRSFSILTSISRPTTRCVTPSVRAIFARMSSFGRAKTRPSFRIPVGCGKTGLASLLPLGLAEGRVIIIAPNLTIRDGLYESYGHHQPPEVFLAESGSVEPRPNDCGTARMHAR